jgi:hypothetical protein
MHRAAMAHARGTAPPSPRFDHAMALLPDGRVIAVGGSNDAERGENGALASVEIYDPATDAWTEGPALHDARRWPNLAVLSDAVYVTGGGNAAGQLASTERLAFVRSPVEPPTDGGGAPDGAGDAGVGDAESQQPPSASGCSCELGRGGSVALLPSLLALLALVSRGTGRRPGAPTWPHGAMYRTKAASCGSSMRPR